MRKSSIGLAAIAALIAGILSPTAAMAATNFSAVASTGATAEVGASITTESGIDPLAAGVYEQVLTQTWPAGRGALGAVNAPGNLALEYLVSGSWVTELPENPLDVNGVRASGKMTSNGILGADQKLTAAVAAGPGTPSAGVIESAGRGDGWDLSLTPSYIINVYHHDANYKLECVIKATSQLCDPEGTYQVDGFATSNTSSQTYYDGKAYSIVLNTATGKPSVICTDVSTLPFVPCATAYVDFAATVNLNSATAQLASQRLVGTKIYGIDMVNQKLLCFDLVSGAECAAPAIDGLQPGNEYSPAFLSLIENKLFVSADEIYCFDVSAALAVACPSWPVAGSYSALSVIPAMNAAGTVIEGVCSIRPVSEVQQECYNFDGSTRLMPAGLFALADAPSTGFRGGEGYFETSAWIGSKVYWASNPNGNDWNAGRATCYDWAIDAACVGFTTTTDISGSRYALVLDPYNANCIWSNGDNGAISSFDATTGAAGCASSGVSTLAFDAPISCSATGAIKDFEKLAINPGPSVALADIRVNLVGSEGQVVFENLSLELPAGEIDLSALTPLETGDTFYFEVKAAAATQEQLEQISGALSYTAEAAQLCVTITPIVAVCPADLTGLTVVPQSDFVVTSIISVALGEAAPTVSAENVTLAVADASAEICNFWSALGASAGDGVNGSGGDAGISDMAWDENGVLYIGGYFNNAGGDPAADNLARWGVNGWEAVGPIDEETSAVSGRVMTLVFNSGGQLLIGGNFEDANGNADADYFAIFDPQTDVWAAATGDPGDPVFDGRVRDIAIHPTTNDVYVGGLFTGRVLKLDSTTYEPSTLGQGDELNSNVVALEFGLDGRLYVGGHFGTHDDFTSRYAATWDGTAWGPLSESQDTNTFSGYVWSFAFAPNKVFVSGDFSGIKMLTIDTDTWSELPSNDDLLDDGGSDQTRKIIVAENGDLYAAGDDYASSSTYFAKFDGTEWSKLMERGITEPTANTSSCDFDWCGAWVVKEGPGNQIWFGGEFGEVAGVSTASNLAVWGPTAATSNTFAKKSSALGPYIAPRLPLTWTPGINPGQVQPSNGKVMLNGAEEPFRKIISKPGGSVKYLGSDWSLDLVGKDPNQKPTVLDNDGNIVIGELFSVTTTGTGFKPFSDVYVYLFSEPTLLGILKTDASGNFIGTLPLPEGTAPGTHTIQVNGYSPYDQVRSAALGIVVLAKASAAAGMQKKVYFAGDSSVLTPVTKRALASIAKTLKGKGNVQIVAEGFVLTGKVTAFDRKLSMDRARAVAKELKRLGVEASYVTKSGGKAVEKTPKARRVAIDVTWTVK